MSEYKVLKYITYFIILIFIQKVSAEAIKGCYHPGQPINCEIFPDKSEYLKGDKLTFSCSEAYVLIGEQKIECLGKNMWSHIFPFCERNFAFGTTPQCLKQEVTVNSTLPSLIMDGDPHTCHELSFEKELKLTVWFEEEIEISKLFVYIKNLSATYNTLQVRSVFSRGYSNEKFKAECDLMNEGIQIESKIFECNNEYGYFFTKFVQLIFSSPQRIDITLCDIRSFTVKDKESTKCDATEFMCENSRCIPLTHVCDGILHCSDGSDESKAKCEHSAAMLIQRASDILMVDMKTGKEKLVIYRNVLAFDYLSSAGTLIWIEKYTNRIYSAPIDKGQPFTELNLLKPWNPVALAVDWIYYHIYWIDGHTVEVADLFGSMRKVLIQGDIEEPKAIALNPFEGLLFWSDSGKSSKIERCGMDGTHRQNIVNTSIASPTGLTLDFTQERIYWVDSRLGTISSANYNGSERKLILSISVDFTLNTKITIYQNSIYWNNLINNTISKADKKTGNIQGEFNTKFRYNVWNILIYHHSKQTLGKNYCAPNNGNCSHLCLPSPRVTDRSTGFTCTCHKGFTLKDDGRNCDPQGYVFSSSSSCDLSREFDCGKSQCIPFSQVCNGNNDCFDGKDEFNCSAAILFTYNKEIRSLNFETGKEKIVIENLQDGFGVDYLFSAGILFWTDRGSRRIQSAPIDTGYPITDIIIDDIMNPYCIAVDWIYFNIYWTDREKQTLEVADVLGNMRKVLIADAIDKPIDIALNPSEGWMFWSDWGSSAKIERCHMDGTHRKIVINKSILWPDGITIDFDQKKIYWCDGRLDTINSANFDGTERKIILQLYLDKHYPASLALYQDLIYWSDWNTDTIYKVNKYEGKNSSTVVDSKYIHLWTLKIYHPRKQPTGRNYCILQKANCSHFCFPSLRLSNESLGYTCACPTGLSMMKDGRSCSDSNRARSCNPLTPPANGQLIPLRRKYLHRQHVNIVCSNGFSLFGSNSTMCNNGTWNYVTSFCEKNLSYKQRISIWKNDIEFIPCQEKLTDGNVSSCMTKTVSSWSALVLNLQGTFILQNITITLQFPHRKNNLRLMLEVANHSGSSQSINCKSSTIGKKRNVKIEEVLCNGKSIAGQMLRVALVAIDNVPINVQLCELTVFALNPRKRCRIVERSPNCLINEMIDDRGNQYILYSPKAGYLLKGKSLRKCVNGYWNNDPPQCWINEFSTFCNSSEGTSANTGHLTTATFTGANETYKTTFILLSFVLAISSVAFFLYKIYSKRIQSKNLNNRIIFRKGDGTTRMDSITQLIHDTDAYNKEMDEHSENAIPL